MDLDVFVAEGEPLSADDIARNVSAEGIDLETHIWEMSARVISSRTTA